MMTQLARYQPAWLTGLERQVDDLFAALPYGTRGLPAGTGRLAPACEVFSRDGDLVVQLDLPGIDPEKDVQVTVQDGVLCVSGERHRPGPGHDGDGVYYRREWRYGRFERGFPLPEGTAGEDITASYRSGVLEVIVPKAAQRAEPRHVPVSAVNGGNGRTPRATAPGAA